MTNEGTSLLDKDQDLTLAAKIIFELNFPYLDDKIQHKPLLNLPKYQHSSIPKRNTVKIRSKTQPKRRTRDKAANASSIIYDSITKGVSLSEIDDGKEKEISPVKKEQRANNNSQTSMRREPHSKNLDLLTVTEEVG